MSTNNNISATTLSTHSVTESTISGTNNSPPTTETLSRTASPRSSTTTTPPEQDNDTSQSVYLQDFLSYTTDNPGELSEVREVGDTLIVNYSVDGNFRTDIYYRALRNYLIDFGTIVRQDYNNNSSDWEVNKMLVHVSQPDGTLSSRYYVYDYWEILRLNDEDIDVTILTGAAGRTISFYSPQNDSWRTSYMPQFRQLLTDSLDDDVRTFRRQTTIFVRLNSTADGRDELNRQLRIILQEYADLHASHYSRETDSYDIPVFMRPVILDVGVRLEGHGHYWWGRISRAGAYRYNIGGYDMDHYLEDLRNTSVRERGRLRDQP